MEKYYIYIIDYTIYIEPAVASAMTWSSTYVLLIS